MDYSSFAVFLTKVFFGFFAIMNPIANGPTFVALTDGSSKAERKAVARKSVLVAFIIIALFCIGGKLLFDLFGFGFNAFQMAGGVIVFLVGMEMLHGRLSKMQSHGGPEDTIDAEASVDIAVSPLAIPILAGPGTITTAMNFASGRDLLHTTATIAVFAVMCIITYVTFLSSEVISAKLGDSFMKVISRLMGLILVAIAMEMFIAGIKGAFLKT